MPISLFRFLFFLHLLELVLELVLAVLELLLEVLELVLEVLELILEVLEFLGVLELVLEVLEQVHAIEADYSNSRVLAASLACLRRNLGPLREKGGAH